MISGSVLHARTRVLEIKQQKQEEAHEFKRRLKIDVKRREKRNNRTLGRKQKLKSEIKEMEFGLKTLYESILS